MQCPERPCWRHHLLKAPHSRRYHRCTLKRLLPAPPQRPCCPWLQNNQFQRLEAASRMQRWRSEEHTSELQSRGHLVCRLLLEKKKYRVISLTVTITRLATD